MFDTKPLSDLCVKITDGSHFSPKQVDEGECIANVKDMREGYIDIEACTRIYRSDFDALRATGCVIQENDVLLSKDGTVGRVVVYQQPDEIGALSSICIIKTSRELLPRFLGQVLSSSFCKRQYENFMSGSAIRRLVLRDIRQIYVPVLTLKDQDAIADILDTLDTQIQKTEAIIAKLQQVKQGLLHDLLTRGVDANGQLRPTREQAPERYKESPLGWIPAEWSYAKLDQLCSHIVDCPHSTPVYQDEGILVARTMHIKNGVFLEDQASKVSDIEYQRRIARLEPKPGDIIFTREAPVGEAFLVPSQMKICLGQRVMVIRPKIGELDGEFLLHHIYSGQIQRKMQLLTAGTTNPHLNVADVRQMLVPLPDLQEQKSIGFTLKNYQQRELYEREKVIKLSRQKAGLMDDLLSGRVRVNHLTL